MKTIEEIKRRYVFELKQLKSFYEGSLEDVKKDEDIINNCNTIAINLVTAVIDNLKTMEINEDKLIKAGKNVIDLKEVGIKLKDSLTDYYANKIELIEKEIKNIL